MIHRAIEIWKEQGSVALVRAGGRFIYWNLGVRTLYLKSAYTFANGSKVTSLAGYTAEFSTDTFTEFERVHSLMNEDSVIKDMLSEVESGDTFYDIGANIGIYSAFFKLAANEGEAIAFEPHPDNQQSIKENSFLNSVEIRIIGVALSDKDDQLLLQQIGEEAGAGEHQLTEKKTGEGIEVDVVPLDRSIIKENIDPPNIVKIDVEGAEQKVIAGAKETFSAENCRVIYCEIHSEKLSDFDSSERELKRLLSDYGYTITETYGGEGSSNKIIKAVK